MAGLTHFSLCSGIGGLDLAAEWAGFKTIAQCEINDYASKNLAKNFKGVHNFGDIRTVTSGSFYKQTGLRTITVISAGFPCQPFSTAGKRRGKEDDRYLWPEVLRVIKELRPTWFIGENVAGFLSMGIDTALSDLESAGYTVRTFVIPACAVGAFHRRDRIFIIAYLVRGRFIQGQSEVNGSGVRLTAQFSNTSSNTVGNVADINSKRNTWSRKEQISEQFRASFQQGCKFFQDVERRFNTYQSRLCRSLHGIPNGVDRVRALGNAAVPQHPYPIFAAIAEIEKQN